MPNYPTLDLNLHLAQSPVAASNPPEYRFLRRDEVRLLVLDRTSGHVEHVRFYELPNYLNAGDVLVVNTSATIPGRLPARRNKERLYIHLATKLSDTDYVVERRTANGGPDRRGFLAGERISIVHPATSEVVATLIIKEQFHPRSRLWHVHCDTDLCAVAALVGAPIRYHYVPRDYDASMYQTIFAHHPGSAEMPSAGRPFTKDVLRNLGRRGVTIHPLILHTGVSSHEVETDLNDHPILPEWYSIPEATAHAVNRARSDGRRVIAVGTTVVRALESSFRRHGRIQAESTWTTDLVTPEYPPQVSTGIVTGMHDSQTSHLAMMYAFTAPLHLRNAYQSAVKEGYLWHEFGDVSLIL